MLEVPFALLVLLSLASGLATSRTLATTPGRAASGRSLKALAIREAVLLGGWGLCCLWPQATFLAGPVSWGNALWIWAIGGAFLVAFGGFAYLVSSFLIGLFSMVPQEESSRHDL